ncbi:MAG: PQQ-binding-like beta-propeller repeat protein [Spirochaetia bacterium]|nr:PQQ-binding-like beta-propeller repeat protein [Spirochaetia bacterium]
MLLLYFSGLYSAAAPLPAQPFSATSEELPPGTQQMALEWKYATGGRVLALTAAFSSGSEVVHLISEDRRLYSLRADGVLLQRSPRLKGRPQPFLQRSPDGTLYSILEPGNLAALNPSGGLIWKLKSADSSPPTQWLLPGHSGLLYTLSEQSISLYTHTGQLIWQEQAELQASSPPEVDPSGSIWIFSREGDLLRIDASGISLRVPVGKGLGNKLSQTAGSSPAVISASHSRVALATGGNIRMYSQTGEFLWKADLFSTAEDISLGAARVYVRTGDQRIAAIDSRSGAELWNTRISMDSAKLAVHSKPVNTLQQQNIETLLVYNQHSIRAYETETGSLLSDRPIPQPAVPPLILDSGRIIIGGQDWVVYSFLSPGSPSKQPLPEHLNPKHLPLPSLHSFPANTLSTAEQVLLEEGGRSQYQMLMEELNARLEKSSAAKNYPGLLVLLTKAAGVGVLNPVRRNGAYINDFPEIRAQAVELLGKYGTLASQQFLLEMLDYEWDAQAQLQIIRAIGSLQSDLSGEVLKTLRNKVKSKKIPITKNPLLTLEIIRSIKAVCTYSGTVGTDAINSLMHIYRSDAPRSLRRLAIQTLRELAQPQ